MKKILILLCAVLLLCTGCGVKKDVTVPDNVPTETDSEEINVMEENSPFGTYSDSRKDIDKDIEIVIKDRFAWNYWLYFNFDYSDGSSNYGDFQNAVEHEYFYRNGKELSDLSLDNYALLFNEYYGVDIETAREYLKYSENYNSQDNTLTPVYDWREENAKDFNIEILDVEHDGDIFTASIIIVYSDAYFSQYSYTYTYDNNGYFVLMNKTGYSFPLMYYDSLDNCEIALYKENNNLVIRKYKDKHLIDCFESDIVIPGMLLFGFETRYELKDNILKIYCEDYPAVVYADLNDQKFTVDIDTKSLLRNGIYTENNNNNSLIMTGRYGVGDISLSDIYFIDGNLKAYYLEAIGGMYGGNADFGFFMNGDVYFFGNTYFHIYEKGILSYRLEDYFGLGECDNVYKFILAVKRNSDRTFTVLYGNEINNFKTFDDIYLNCTYQLAIIDYEGNIIKNIDTGINVYYSPFGLCRVSMRESDGIVYFEVKFKDTVIGKYEVNLNTGEVKMIDDTK